MNAIATTCCTLMPALLPSCATFFEEGLRFLDGKLVPKILSTCTDGLIKCISHSTETGCGVQSAQDHSNIILHCDVKAQQEKDLSVDYTIPTNKACDLLCCMKSTNTQKCWFVSYSKQSLTLSSLEFDETVWNKTWSILLSIYDKSKPTLPKRKTDDVVELKNSLNEYIESNSTLIAEIPCCECMEVTYFDGTFNDAYLDVLPSIPKQIPNDSVLCGLHNLCTDSITLTEEAFELVRKKATEIFAFILTNTDRAKSKKNNLAHIPIAYAMKGNSLTTKTVRQMMDQVRNKCKEEGVQILCEVSDGQWHPNVIKDKDHYPLTRLQFQKFIWNIAMSMKKEDMLDYLVQFGKIDNSTLDELSIQKDVCLTNSTIRIGNLQVKCEFHRIWKKGKLELHKRFTMLTRGGLPSQIPLMRYIRTIPNSVSERIWKSSKCDPQETKEDIDVTTSDIYSQLPISVHEDAYHLIQNVLLEEVSEIDTQEIVVDEEPDETDNIISGSQNDDSPEEEANILSDMLQALQNYNHKNIWHEINPRTLFTEYLQDAKIIASAFVTKELDEINNVYYKYFKQNLFKKTDLKETKVNNLCSKFGNKTKWFKQRRKVFQPQSLDAICRTFLKSSSVPKMVLACPVAFIKHKLELEVWESTFTVPCKIAIPHRRMMFELFSYPEYNEDRSQLEPKCLDATHILTNLRAHACRNGFHNVDKNAFLRASQADSTYLPRTIIEDIIDQQNAEYAKKVFSVRVQQLMQQNGDYPEAKFVKRVRQWYKACDDRGISALDRIDRFIEMHNYLTNGVTFNTFPPPSNYIKGIPIVTYEAILQNISTRIALYAFANKHTFNNRAISTLGVESFFSDLARSEFTQTGCPKACHIPKLISVVCEINSHKHNPDKVYTVDQRRGNNYPVTELEQMEYDETDHMTNNQTFGIFNSHPFDIFQRTTKSRCRYQANVALPNQTERGKLSIREFYRRNEFKLNNLQRLSLPKNFENEDM